ncbi:hypothetical protein Pla52n_45370 [Stieleria varia]|uniref:DUF2752 domain-containing protein n=1 Tax=Stieleria varia TaxID=2528005 RepID=A0A5C6AMC2_9BACT|nr:hypothetical protein Pla52n_45370 [Stieleria varia]
MVALSLAAALIVLLLIAGSLSPSAQGLGTHQQLGLPPCSSLVMLGVRCPSCGMTTSWSYFVRGMWWQSARTNSGGFLLALGAIALIIYCLSVARRGRVPGVAAQRGIALTLFAIMVVTLTDWAIRLAQ